MSTKLYDFWRDYDTRILTVFAIILTAFVAFRAGQTHEREESSAKIDVSINQLAAANPAEQKIKILGDTLERKGIMTTNLVGSHLEETQNASIETTKCFLFGSKNSNKYHTSSCKRAKAIKEKNRVCFSSEEDARNKNYQPAKCCH